MNKTILLCIISVIISCSNALAGKEPPKQKPGKQTTQKTIPALPNYSRNDIIDLITQAIIEAGKPNIALHNDIINNVEQLDRALDPERYSITKTQNESVILIPLTINRNTGELFTEQDDPALAHHILLEVHVDQSNNVIKIIYIDPHGGEIAENLMNILKNSTNNVTQAFTLSNHPQLLMDQSSSGAYVIDAAKKIIDQTEQIQAIEHNAAGNTVYHDKQNAPVDERYTTDDVDRYVGENCASANNKFGTDTRQSFAVVQNKAMLKDNLDTIKNKSNPKGARLIFIPILIDASTEKPVGDNPDVTMQNIVNGYLNPLKYGAEFRL